LWSADWPAGPTAIKMIIIPHTQDLKNNTKYNNILQYAMIKWRLSLTSKSIIKNVAIRTHEHVILGVGCDDSIKIKYLIYLLGEKV